MGNWAITHKKSGEVQFVKHLEGVDKGQWSVKKISREPTQFHGFVDGKLQLDKTTQLAHERESKFSGRSLQQIAAEFDERLSQIEALLNERKGVS